MRREMLRNRASRRWRAGIVYNPIPYLSSSCISLNIFRCNDGCPGTLSGSDPGAIDARGKMRGIHSIDPGMKIAALFRKQAPPFLLVEEDDRLRWKTFRPSGANCRRSVGTTQFGCIPGSFDLFEIAAIEQNEEAEPCRVERLSFSSPGICFRSGRIVQPIARIGEVQAESLQRRIARVFVAIESYISSLTRRTCSWVCQLLKSGGE